MIEFSTIEKEGYTLVHFQLDAQLQPEMLADIAPPSVDRSKGVVLSGRGPIWLYAFLTHHYHVTKFVATHDPRLNGGVVIESHHPSYEVGKVIDVKNNSTKKKTT